MYLENIYDRNANKHLIQPAEETCIRDESDSGQKNIHLFGFMLKTKFKIFIVDNLVSY